MKVSIDIDIFFAVFFTMECIMKVIALGFVEEKFLFKGIMEYTGFLYCD